MDKADEHIIDWILKKTERKSEREHWKVKKRAYSHEKRKIEIDKMIFLCVICKKVWSKVPHFIDEIRWRAYPKGNIPTYGKARKICPNCQKEKAC
tara:strand:- start:5843 stop:6127 length:285 start_codon:yes stop_codon:yes gene_type:complete